MAALTNGITPENTIWREEDEFALKETRSEVAAPTALGIAKRAAAVAVCLALAVAAACGPSHKMYAQRINSENVDERRAAARGLRGEKLNAKMVPIVLQACRDKDADVRRHAFLALGKVNPREEGVVAVVFEGMNDPEVEVRRAVASILGEFDPFPSATIPYMVRMLTDPDETVRRLTNQNFLGLEGTGVATLIRNLSARDDNLRIAVIHLLGTMGPRARSAIQPLKKIAEEEELPEIKDWAGKAVAAIEGGARMPREMPAITSEREPGPRRQAAPQPAEEPRREQDAIQTGNESGFGGGFDFGGFDFGGFGN
jgi:HEAT repeat protein